jgi:protein CpxP
MKLNKSSILAILAVGAFMVSAPVLRADDATTNTSPTPAAHKRVSPKMMVDKLGLNDDQKDKFMAAYKDFNQKRKDLRADTTISDDDRKAKMKDAMSDLESKMKDVLTADQLTQWKELAMHHHKKAAEDAPAPTAPAPDAPKQ